MWKDKNNSKLYMVKESGTKQALFSAKILFFKSSTISFVKFLSFLMLVNPIIKEIIVPIIESKIKICPTKPLVVKKLQLKNQNQLLNR